MADKTSRNDEGSMTWLPCRRYELISTLSPAQIKEKFEQASGYLFLKGFVYTSARNTDSFVLDFMPAYIRIKELTDFRLGGYTNSFKPQATIIVQDIAGGGSKLRVVLKPGLSSMLFLVLALTFIIAGVLFSKMNDLMLGKYKDVAIVCSTALIFGYLLPTVAFNADLSKLELFIDDFFQVEYAD